MAAQAPHPALLALALTRQSELGERLLGGWRHAFPCSAATAPPCLPARPPRPASCRPVSPRRAYLLRASQRISQASQHAEVYKQRTAIKWVGWPVGWGQWRGAGGAGGQGCAGLARSHLASLLQVCAGVRHIPRHRILGTPAAGELIDKDEEAGAHPPCSCCCGCRRRLHACPTLVTVLPPPPHLPPPHRMPTAPRPMCRAPAHTPASCACSRASTARSAPRCSPRSWAPRAPARRWVAGGGTAGGRERRQVGGAAPGALPCVVLPSGVHALPAALPRREAASSP